MDIKRLYVDFHVLQTVPPSCVNRDDTGSPKTAVYGGATRARVSSQAWKHAIRKMFIEEMADMVETGKRTLKATGPWPGNWPHWLPELDDARLIFSMVYYILIATTKASKRIISALYQSPSWKLWILSYLGVKDLTPTKYVEIIQKAASLEKVCFDEYVSSLNNILKENDIEEIFKSLTQLQPTPFLSEKDTNNISEVKDVADKVIQLRTAYTYDNASDISNAIERKIADIKEGLLLYPTKVSCCHISALLIKISDICSKTNGKISRKQRSL